MKGLKRTRWGAIALVIALVLASSLKLTGCDFGLGPNRGYDPVGIWRGSLIGDFGRYDITLTFLPNGTGTGSAYVFHNNQLVEYATGNFIYTTEGNIITVHPGAGTFEIGGTFVFTDRNTIIWQLGFYSITFRRN